MSGEEGRIVGKLPSRQLASILGRAWLRRTPSTVVGPSIGEDAAVVRLGLLDLVFHVDPITEAGELAGRLAVIVASNDVAVTGARPRWLSLAYLVPPGSGTPLLERLVSDAEKAAGELGVEIVGGHTEFSPGLSKPVVVAAAVGVTCAGCSVPTGDAMPGDLILQVKPAAMEGTAILSTDFRRLLEERGVPSDVIERGARLADNISVVREAVELAEARVVSSMHDPTEGGILGGLVEMAVASGTTISIFEDKIIVRDETRVVSRALGVDFLKLISSGTLLAAVPRSRLNDALEVLEDLKVEYSLIGEVVNRSSEPGVILFKSTGEKQFHRDTPRDEISRFWS